MLVFEMKTVGGRAQGVGSEVRTRKHQAQVVPLRKEALRANQGASGDYHGHQYPPLVFIDNAFQQDTYGTTFRTVKIAISEAIS